MITGLTIERMKTEIQSLPIRPLEVKAIYGFGSFFRAETFRDIDLVVVLLHPNSQGLASYYKLKKQLDHLAKRLGVLFHLSVFTEDEFKKKPLRDMDELTLLNGSA